MQRKASQGAALVALMFVAFVALCVREHFQRRLTQNIAAPEQKYPVAANVKDSSLRQKSVLREQVENNSGSSSGRSIKQISILGERNSGSRWTYE